MLIYFFPLSTTFSLPPPVADFTANNTTVCIGQQVAFTNASTGNITSYSWNFGSGASPATASTIGPHNVTYSTSGQKTVSLTVNGPDGPSTITKTNYITVNSIPVLSGSITGNTNTCLNAQGVQYSIASNPSATSYSWTSPSGSTIASGQGTNIVNINFGSASGNVCVTATNTCGTSNQLCKQVSVGKDRIKFMSYNLLNYPDVDGGSITADTTLRNPFYRTIVSSVDPDILVIQELISQTGLTAFLNNVMNANGPVYSAGTFINGFDTDNGILYKTSKFSFISNTPIETDLRDISEFKLLHLLSGDTVRIYSVHLKASATPDDEDQRALEIDSLRKKTNALAAGSNFIVCGDFNIYKSSESAYQKLLQVDVNNEGHFIDPITLSGTWNNSSYSIYHTQSPRVRAFGGGSTGGMDDRFDLILYSKAISLTGGMSYVSGSLMAYGNDGNHYNDSINQPPNTAVSQTIADALHNASDHIPVVASFDFDNSSCSFVDFGATNLISPTPPSCSNSTQPLQVQIKNYGSSLVNFSTNNLQVVLQIINPALTTTTYTTTVSSGTISPSSFLTVTFNNTFDMSSPGTYTFNAHTIFSGDTTTSNNSMASINVIVIQNTNASITPGGPTTFCSGSTVLLTANQNSGVTYQWQKNGTNISGATSQNYTASQSGNFSVVLQKSSSVNSTYPSVTFSNSNSYAIPDNSCTGATSIINVSGYVGNISSSGISIKVNINHVFTGNLVMYLEAPNGDRLGLANRVGSSGDHFTNTIFSDGGAGQLPATGAPYTGTYKPWTINFTSCVSNTKTTFGSIGFGSINPNGNWKLLVYDRASLNVGTLVNWQITFPSYSATTTLVCDPVTSAPLTVNSIPPPVITISPPTPAVCSGNAVVLTASGASTYVWSPATGLSTTSGAVVSANPPIATSYLVVGTDAFGCTNSKSVTVNISQSTSASLTPFNNVCENITPFALTGGQPSGGVYSGTGVSNNMFYPATAGPGNHLITYTYTNAGGCSASASETIFVAALPDATITPAGPITLCQNSSVNLSVNPGYTYLWSNAVTTQNNLINTNGNYSVTVTDANGCSSVSSLVTVTTSALAITGTVFYETMGSVGGTTAISTHETNNGFDNDNFTMSGTGDVRNTVFTMASFVSNSGGANIFLTDQFNKNFIISGIITTSLSNLELSFGIQKQTNASTGSDLLVKVSTDGTNYTTLSYPALVTGTGSTNWQYATVIGSIPSVPNLRILFSQEDTVCQYRIDDVKLTYTISNPSINASGPTDFCQGNSVILSASNNLTYLWNNGQTIQNINVNTSGNYYCTMTAGNGCSAGSNVISVSVKPTIFSITGGGSYCSGSNGVPIGLSASETGVNYQLKNGGANIGGVMTGNGNPLNFGNQTLAGTYTVVGTNTSAGCTATMSGTVNIIVNSSPDLFDVTGNNSYCQGGTGTPIGLNGSQSGVSYTLLINGSSTGNTVNGNNNTISFGNVLTPGDYSVLAVNNISLCSRIMNDTITVSINLNPDSHSVTGGGDFCLYGAGLPIGLSSSENNISYQLQVNNTNIGSPISGNGNPLLYGNQTTPGDYTVLATNTITGCTSSTLNFATINILPNPQVANVTGGGSYCAVPGDGVPVGLSNSETGISYQLYLDNNVSGTPVNGNGLPITFGNQVIEGNYTVIATNISTTCSDTMNGNVSVILFEVTNWYEDQDGDGYGNPLEIITDCTQPSGYIVDNTDCNDTIFSSNPGAIEICGNGIDDNCNNLIDENCASEISLTVKFFIEGFYSGNGKLVAVADPLFSPALCDTIIIKLAEQNSPNTIVYSDTVLVDTSGIALLSVPSSGFFGNSYYIVLVHRNTLETWSAFPVLLDQSVVNYDFTTGISQAFGSNQKDLGDGTFGILSGDINHDGYINTFDFNLAKDSIMNFADGYLNSDLTGDHLVESSDFSLIENNLVRIFVRP